MADMTRAVAMINRRDYSLMSSMNDSDYFVHKLVLQNTQSNSICRTIVMSLRSKYPKSKQPKFHHDAKKQATKMYANVAAMSTKIHNRQKLQPCCNQQS